MPHISAKIRHDFGCVYMTLPCHENELYFVKTRAVRPETVTMTTGLLIDDAAAGGAADAARAK